MGSRLQLRLILHACIISFFAQGISCAADFTLPGDWPQFRGRHASGVSAGPAPPTEWDVESGKNILWKTEIPGLGLASPIVSRGHVFVVTATSGNDDLKIGLYGDISPVQDNSEHDWKLLCLSAKTGQLFWERTLHTGVPTIQRHTKASHANSTPATNGKYVVVFLGSEGLYCYDYSGKEIWKRDFGKLDSGFFMVKSAQWGFASSPIIHNDRVIVQVDVQDESFIASLDIKTGKDVWRTKREDVPGWSTPAVTRVGDRDIIVANGFRHSGAYDAATGEEVWKLGLGGDIPVPTPVFGHGNVYLSSAHGFFRPLRAIRLDATGELKVPKSTDPKTDKSPFAWYQNKEGIYQGTPLVYGDNLYACRGNGLLSCFDAKTGERKFRDRLNSGNSGFTASAVAAGGQLYLPSESGVISVVKAGDKFELLAKNDMQDICMASPAIVNGTLFVRTKKHIFAIGDPAADPSVELAAAEDSTSTSSVVSAAPGAMVNCLATPRRTCCCCRCQRVVRKRVVRKRPSLFSCLRQLLF